MTRRSSILPEQRTTQLAATDFAIRATDNADPVFVGHAAVFNTRTSIGNPFTWGFYEQIAPGAFTKTLQEGDARFLVDHDTSMIVARVSAGDLQLHEDAVGLATAADLDQEVSYIRDLARNIEKQRITGMSFGFRVVKDDWTTEEVQTSTGDPLEVEVRTIREVELLEVSAVTFPAYEETDAGLRATATALRNRQDAAAVRRRADHNELLAEIGEIREPDDTTHGKTDVEPADATRLTVAHLRLRQQGLAALYRIR